MTTPPERYTAEQIRNLAGLYGGELKQVLLQAASDVRDAARYRFLKDHQILSGDPDGWIDENIGLDTAMGERDE